MPDLGQDFSALCLNLTLDADSPYDVKDLNLIDAESLYDVNDLNLLDAGADSTYDVKDLNLMTLLMAEDICEHTFILSVRTVW